MPPESRPRGLGAIWTLAAASWSLQRLDSAPPPGVGAAWQHNWTRRRLDSAPPPGLCSALTRGCRLVSALRGLGAASVNSAGTRRRCLDLAPHPDFGNANLTRLRLSQHRRLDSTPPSGLCSALTRRCRLVSALRRYGTASASALFLNWQSHEFCLSVHL